MAIISIFGRFSIQTDPLCPGKNSGYRPNIFVFAKQCSSINI